MFADIPLTLASDHLLGIDQYQPIDTVVEIGIDPEIEEADRWTNGGHYTQDNTSGLRLLFCGR
jgi:hypothetical protein